MHYVGADNVKVYPITFPTFENTTIEAFLFRPYPSGDLSFDAKRVDIALCEIPLVEGVDYSLENIAKANTSLNLIDASGVPMGTAPRQEWLTNTGDLKQGWILVIHFIENALQPATLANNSLLAPTVNKSIDRLAMHIKALYHMMGLVAKYSERTVLANQPYAPFTADEVQISIIELQNKIANLSASMGGLNGSEGDFLQFATDGTLEVKSGIFEGQSSTLGRYVTTTSLHDAIEQLFAWQTNPPQISIQSTPAHGGNKEKGIPFNVTNLRLVLTRGSEADLASATMSISGIGVASAVGASSFPYSFSKPATMTGLTQNIDTPLTMSFTDTLTVSASVTQANAETANASITYNFVYPSYFGRGTRPLTDTELKNLSKYLNSTRAATLPCSAGSNHYCYAYPASYGNLSNIVQSLFPTIPTIANWTKRTTTLVMADGASVLYNVYETNVPSSTSSGNWIFS